MARLPKGKNAKDIAKYVIKILKHNQYIAMVLIINTNSYIHLFLTQHPHDNQYSNQQKLLIAAY